MGGKRPNRTDAELEHGFEGTDYGMRQMLWSGLLLSEPSLFHRSVGGVVSDPIEPWIRNALIESFLNNSRRLAWFLHRAHEKDAYAGDYLSSWGGRPLVGPIIGRVSDALSHRDTWRSRGHTSSVASSTRLQMACWTSSEALPPQARRGTCSSSRYLNL